MMEWEGKTIYDLLNFAKDEAVKINVIRKDMENELERIKKIGKEKENIEKIGIIGNDYDGFSMAMRDLFIKYGIPSMKAINSDSMITKDMIRGFVIGGEE